MGLVQRKLVESYPHMRNIVEPVARAHLTLLAFMAEENRIEEAREIIKGSRQQLRKMNRRFLKAYQKEGFPCDEIFNPRVTLGKTDYKGKKEVGEVDRGLLDQLGGKYFGILDLVQLLSMKKTSYRGGFLLLRGESHHQARVNPYQNGLKWETEDLFGRF